jgi:hypothetical protein
MDKSTITKMFALGIMLLFVLLSSAGTAAANGGICIENKGSKTQVVWIYVCEGCWECRFAHPDRGEGGVGAKVTCEAGQRTCVTVPGRGMMKVCRFWVGPFPKESCPENAWVDISGEEHGADNPLILYEHENSWRVSMKKDYPPQ